MQNEPPGFGKAHFGMSVEEVRKIYPQMEVLTKNLGAASIGGPFVQRFVIRKLEVPGISKPTKVEFRFWKEQLWVVIIYFRTGDLDAVAKTLTERHGPFEGKPEDAVWSGEKATVMVAGKANWYSIHDNAISKEAQAAVMEEVRRTMEHRKDRARKMAARTNQGTVATPTAGMPQTLATPESSQ